MRSLLKTCLAALVCVTAFVPNLARGAEEFEVNFQSPYAGPHVLNLQFFEPWIADIKEKSQGKLEVHFFQNGALTKTADVIPNIITGSMDIGGSGVHYQDVMFPFAQVFQLPHMAKDSVESSKVMWALYENIPEIKAEMDKNAKFLTLWGSDRTALFSTTGKAMLTPADLKGKRVLIWNGSYVDMIKAWGGVPVQVTPGDTYIGLQRGMGDVFFGPLPMGVAYKLMEVSKHITVLPAVSVFGGVWMNRELWNELPKDMQDLLEGGMGATGNKRAGDLLLAATNKDIITMQKAGCTIYNLTPAQEQAFEDADMQVSMAYWAKELARLGVKDPDALIKRAYEIAEAAKK